MQKAATCRCLTNLLHVIYDLIIVYVKIAPSFEMLLQKLINCNWIWIEKFWLVI